MPLADLNAVCNLALDHLGEPYLTDYLTDTTTAAAACRVHLTQCVETVLEGHVWSFATRCSRLTAVPIDETAATLTTGEVEDNNAILFTAVETGPSGNEITVTIATANPDSPEIIISVSGAAISITPPAIPGTIEVSGAITINSAPVVVPDLIFAGTLNDRALFTETGIQTGSYRLFWDPDFDRWLLQVFENSWEGAEDVQSPLDVVGTWTALEPGGGGNPAFSGTVANTAADIISALTADSATAALVTAVDADSSDGTGVVATMSATNLSGGSSTSTVFAPAFGSAFNLPADCLRVIKLDGEDPDRPQNRWEIIGRNLLLHEENATAPVIHYITKDAPVDEWPTTFTDAVAWLLASRIAPKLSQDENLANGFLQKHEIALGKARSKDARETRSKENHGPRHLAARSGLVNARYGNTRPPY